MATKWYLHDAATTIGGTLPDASSQSATSPTTTAAGAATNRTMDIAVGASQITVTTAVLLTDTSVWHRRYVSPALAAQYIDTGSWTLSAAASESLLTVNMLAFGMVLYLWRPSSGLKIETLLDVVTGTTEPGTTETAVTETKASGVSTHLLDGDVLILEVWNSFGITATGDVSFYYDGTVEGSNSDNAAYLQAPPDSHEIDTLANLMGAAHAPPRIGTINF